MSLHNHLGIAIQQVNLNAFGQKKISHRIDADFFRNFRYQFNNNYSLKDHVIIETMVIIEIME